MSHWSSDIEKLLKHEDACILVTVAEVRGSAPRETGAKMIVTATETIGTIGGGQLEYQCTKIAVQQLRHSNDDPRRMTRRFPLGTNCGQCCGGVVDVVFERVAACDATGWLAELNRLYGERRPVVLLTPNDNVSGPAVVTDKQVRQFHPQCEIPADVIAAARRLLQENGEARVRQGFLLEPLLASHFSIAIFGAGHVGAAIVDVLSRLDCHIRWIDSRRDIIPATLPRNVTAIESANPAREVAAMPAESMFLIMTHSHPLDFEICSQVLLREDAAYCGLIGSLAKRRRFERQMRKQGLTDAMFDRLCCPIGVAGVTSKKPVDIAIAVSAQLLRIRDAARVANEDNDDLSKNPNVHAI